MILYLASNSFRGRAMKFDVDKQIKGIKKMTVTPSYYKVMENKYGKKWAKAHCVINWPVQQDKYEKRV